MRDTYRRGDWKAMCFKCGRDNLASRMKKHWEGYWVCPEHWEPRHPQDFVRAGRVEKAPPWTQPEAPDQFLPVCSPDGQTALPGLGTPGCLQPSYIHPANTLEI